jgi:hypothetical protein
MANRSSARIFKLKWAKYTQEYDTFMNLLRQFNNKDISYSLHVELHNLELLCNFILKNKDSFRDGIRFTHNEYSYDSLIRAVSKKFRKLVLDLETKELNVKNSIVKRLIQKMNKVIEYYESYLSLKFTVFKENTILCDDLIRYVQEYL